MPSTTCGVRSCRTAQDQATGARLLWKQLPDGDSVGSSGSPFLYDPAGRLKTVPNLLATALYNARGQATSLALAILGSGPRTAVTTSTSSAARFWLLGRQTVA